MELRSFIIIYIYFLNGLFMFFFGCYTFLSIINSMFFFSLVFNGSKIQLRKPLKNMKQKHTKSLKDILPETGAPDSPIKQDINNHI